MRALDDTPPTPRQELSQAAAALDAADLAERAALDVHEACRHERRETLRAYRALARARVIARGHDDKRRIRRDLDDAITAARAMYERDDLTARQRIDAAAELEMLLIDRDTRDAREIDAATPVAVRLRRQIGEARDEYDNAYTRWQEACLNSEWGEASAEAMAAEAIYSSARDKLEKLGLERAHATDPRKVRHAAVIYDEHGAAYIKTGRTRIVDGVRVPILQKVGVPK